MFIELIKVVVGKREAVFEVHRKYLLETPYFSRLLDGLLREGGSTQASLPDDSPAACERVLRYVYTGKVVSNIPGPECPDGYENGNEAIDETLLVMRMYLLADKLCLEDLANDLIDELRKSYKTWNISDYELKLALEYGNQTLKRLTLRKLVYQIKQDGWETVVTGNPDKIGKLLRSNAQHGMDVAKAISGYHDLDDLSRDADSCSWHVHEMRSKCDGPQGRSHDSTSLGPASHTPSS